MPGATIPVRTCQCYLPGHLTRYARSLKHPAAEVTGAAGGARQHAAGSLERFPLECDTLMHSGTRSNSGEALRTFMCAGADDAAGGAGQGTAGDGAGLIKPTRQ